MRARELSRQSATAKAQMPSQISVFGTQYSFFNILGLFLIICPYSAQYFNCSNNYP